MNELKILVIGNAGSGKTTIAYTIAKLLKQEGFDVDLVPDMDGLEYELLPLEVRAKSLQDTGLKITVDQVQSARTSGGQLK